MKYNRHVPSSTPLPCSIRRRAKRTSCSTSPCIKYASGQMPDPFTLYTQRSVGSSGHSSPQSLPSSVLYGSPSPSSPSPPSSRGSVTEYPSQPPLHSRPTPRIQVASLLADPQTRYNSPFHPSSCPSSHHQLWPLYRSYHLEIVQHPQKTAEFGNSNLSRLPVTPPIIAQLTVRDPSGNSVVPYVLFLYQMSFPSSFGCFGVDNMLTIGWSIFGCIARRSCRSSSRICRYFRKMERHR